MITQRKIREDSTTFDIHARIAKLLKISLIVTATSISLILIDLMDDFAEHVPFEHLLHEALIMTVYFLASLYLTKAISNLEKLLYRATQTKRVEIERLNRFNEFLSVSNVNLKSGISDKIQQQLNGWKLTKAEKEVAMLLLKGYSQKQISSIRQISSRTVREHSSKIYIKSGLQNRAELASFFIEDFLQF